MNISELIKALEALYERKDGSLSEFVSEKPHLEEALRLISQKLNDAYEFVAPIDRGGAGVIIKLRDTRLGSFRALKIPRPRKDELLDSLHNEIDHLTSLNHESLVRIYAAGEVHVASLSVAFPYFVMEFITNPRDFVTACQEKLSTISNASQLPLVTSWVATNALSIAHAVEFLHASETIHFDIKPANILFTPTDKPILTDLGFAKKRSADTTETVIGFTLFYAHPDLRTNYDRMSSQNRVRRKKAPIEFRFEWDLYSYGRTLLQLLAHIAAHFPDAVMYDYSFLYLHLLACRMLDGRNLPEDESSQIQDEQSRKGEAPSIYHEHWLTLQRQDMAQIKYAKIQEVCVDLEKLLDRTGYLTAVPELSPHYPHRVQVAATAPAPFSPRIKALVEHPVFLRLRTVMQLGVADAVYPGCTHTRAEHSLGAFRMACLYLQSLLHDPYNPIFLQLTSSTDLKCILAASLLHDLGQYPLAHDLEDAAPATLRRSVSHERLNEKWLDNTSTDSEGRTIGDILGNRGGEWALNLDTLRRLLRAEDESQLPFETRSLKFTLLRSIIDGPLDVDKLDYLVRDSSRANLPYGSFIDVDRLVRSLTVVLSRDDKGRSLLTLGTYEKGQSAAESATFARYEMYQAVYWHHAVRAIRPMLREVLRSSRFEKTKGKASFTDAFESCLGVTSEPRAVTLEDILSLLDKYASDHGRELIMMIKNRRFYKRLLTIHSYIEEEGRAPLLQRFRDCQRRPDFDGMLQCELTSRLEGYITGVSGPQPSVLSKEHVDPVLRELQKPGRILTDSPTPRAGSQEKLRFALEPKRRLQNYASRIEVGERVSEVWQQVFFRLMEIASKGRVYCHPSVRDALMAALGPSGIKDAVKAMVTRCDK